MSNQVKRMLLLRSHHKSCVAQGAPGFTLIELLVVISIIALLIGLLLPALTTAREHARASVCMSHMQHLGYAMANYVADNDEYMPREGKGHEIIIKRDPLIYQRYYYPWPRAFHKYITKRLPFVDKGEGYYESYETFSDNDLDSTMWQRYRYRDMIEYQCPSYPNPLHNIHYINNGLLTRRNGPADQNIRHPTTPITEFTRPSAGMYMAEFTDDPDDSIAKAQKSYPYLDHWYDVWAEVHVNGPEEKSNGYGGNVARIKSDRHLGTGSNTLFVDSHIERRSRDTLKDIDNWDDHTYNEWWR